MLFRSHDGIAGAVLRQFEAETNAGVERDHAEETTHHDAEAGSSATSRASRAPEPATPIPTELSLLERMVKDPLSLYLKETLGIDTWRDDDEPIPATVPLELEKKQARLLTLELLEQLVSDASCADAWIDAKQRSGILPVGPYALRQVAEIRALAEGLKQGAESHGLDLAALVNKDVGGVLSGRHRLVGSLQGVHEAAPAKLVSVTADETGPGKYGLPIHLAGLHLLAARAADIPVACATIISRRDDWRVGALKKPTRRNPEPRLEDAWQTRTVKLAPPLMDRAAAAERLDALAALAHEATAAARPGFGQLRTSAADRREVEFERALEGSFYLRTGECALFGVSPTFAEVFTDHPERLAFLDAFNRLLAVTFVRQGEAHYLLS